MTKAGAWEYELQVTRAALAQAVAQQQQVETDLERLTVRSLADGEVLQVDIRPGEFVAAPSTKALILVGDVDQLHVRVDIDEHDIPRFRPGARAKAMLKGHAAQEFAMQFVRVEPYVIPKKSLTGENTERVDTRVLPVIYSIERGAMQSGGQRLYVGQQVDAYIDASDGAATPGLAGG
jgi:multidrug resistance efflux pump